MSVSAKQFEQAGAEAPPPLAGGRVDLSAYDASWYRPGGAARRLAWYVCNAVCFNSWLLLPSAAKCALLRLFGARVGRGVVIKPRVNIKYPWFLTVGDHVWIGEGAWIDNLAHVEIGDHVCVSQGAYLLTGNHDYKRVSFDLIVKPIRVKTGAWVGARATVCPGVKLGSHSVVTAGSVIQTEAEPFTIYAGNPARPIRRREVR